MAKTFSSDAEPRADTVCPGNFPAEESRVKGRIKGPSNNRFETIFQSGRRVGGPILRVTALYPGSGCIGIATAKKIGGKPKRNRAKRRVRAAIQGLSDRPDERLDYVIVLSESGAAAPFGQIEGEVRRLLADAVTRWAEELASS